MYNYFSPSYVAAWSEYIDNALHRRVISITQNAEDLFRHFVDLLVVFVGNRRLYQHFTGIVGHLRRHHHAHFSHSADTDGVD